MKDSTKTCMFCLHTRKASDHLDACTGSIELYSEQLHNFYALPNNIRVNMIMAIKSRRMVWAGHAARTEEMRRTHALEISRQEKISSLARTRCRREDAVTTNHK
jgi:hypothetical protein